MHFEWTITLQGLMILGGIVSTGVGAVWALRGQIDEFKKDLGDRMDKSQEEMKQRHRQNTNRLDWLLGLINQERAESGKPAVPCPYRQIVDP